MNDEQKQSTPASREAENDTASRAGAVAGAVAGGLIGAAAGPTGAAIGAAAGGAVGRSIAMENVEEMQASGSVSGRGPQDERFADPKTDVDWRTSDSGLTSIGATDENADTATVPSDQPGVRTGDTDTPVAQRNLERTRSSISGEEDMNQAGLDVGPLTNPDPIGDDTPPANQAAPNADLPPKNEPARNEDVPPPSSPTSSSSTTSLPAGGPDVASGGQQTIGGNLPQM